MNAITTKAIVKEFRAVLKRVRGSVEIPFKDTVFCSAILGGDPLRMQGWTVEKTATQPMRASLIAEYREVLAAGRNFAEMPDTPIAWQLDLTPKPEATEADYWLMVTA